VSKNYKNNAAVIELLPLASTETAHLLLDYISCQHTYVYCLKYVLY